MDRFIAKNLFYLTKFFKDLKSNMDRFIVYRFYVILFLMNYLKSNMDRFIDAKGEFINYFHKI